MAARWVNVFKHVYNKYRHIGFCINYVCMYVCMYVHCMYSIPRTMLLVSTLDMRELSH